jgi:hypothetical protein
MPNLVFLVETKTHTSVTNTKNMLEGNGHTVTLYDKTELTGGSPPDLSGFDCALWVRGPNSSDAADYVRSECDTHDIPLLMGMTGGINNGQNLTVGGMVWYGLCNEVFQHNAYNEIDVNSVVHDITDTFNDTRVTVTSGSNDFQMCPELADGYVGTVLATREDSSNCGAIIAIEKGTDDVNSVEIKSRVVLCSFLYGLVGYSSDAETMIENMIEWAMGSGVEAFPVNRLKKGLVSGFHSFTNQYVLSKVEALTPLKLPDGTTF